jgi:hypothetical protein
MKRALPVFTLALALIACGRQHVVTQPELPPLAPPAPPPRVVTPPEPEEAPPTAKPPETPVRKPARPSARNPEPAREAPKVEPTKPPVKPETPPVRDENSEKTLQTLPPANQAELQRQARDLVAQATQDLKNVPYKKLNADARGQYDQAKRFIDQAQQALKEQNFVLAQRLAEKAATIAGVLVGR